MLLNNTLLKRSQNIMYSSVGITLATLAIGASAQAATITVSGQSNPWLAGMPSGSTAQERDKAFSGISLNQSPVEISLLSGSIREFVFTEVTGSVSNSQTASFKAPDGTKGNVTHRYGAENGISGLKAPQNSLVGVFLGNDAPNLSAAPAGLDYTLALRNQPEFSPLLKQVFFIGDGKNDLGALQKFFAPQGATRLFLGTMDAYKWSDNKGSFQVTYSQTSVPEPTTIIGTLTFGALGGGAWLKRKKKSVAA